MGSATIDSTKQALYIGDATHMRYWNKDTALDVSKGTTMSCWYYRSGSKHLVEYLIGVGNSDSNWWAKPFGIIPYNANGNKVAYPMVNASAYKTYTETDLNKWVFMAGSTSTLFPNDSGTLCHNIKLYMDTSLIASATNENAGYCNGKLQSKVYLGNSQSNSGYAHGFVGWIKYCKIWNRELSSEEILELYNQEKDLV